MEANVKKEQEEVANQKAILVQQETANSISWQTGGALDFLCNMFGGFDVLFLPYKTRQDETQCRQATCEQCIQQSHWPKRGYHS